MLKKHPAAQQELCIIVSAERAAAGNATVLAFCVSLGALKGLFQQSQQSQHDAQRWRTWSLQESKVSGLSNS